MTEKQELYLCASPDDPCEFRSKDGKKICYWVTSGHHRECKSAVKA